MKIVFAIAMSAVLALGAALPGSHEEPVKPKPAPAAAPAGDADVVRAQKPSYPLTKCVVSGEALDAKAVDHVVDGRLVRLCCADCKAAVDKDKAGTIAKIDAAVVAAQKASYPLKTCPVSGEKLDAKGGGFDVVEGTKLVRLCCKDCKGGFEKDRAAMMAKVDQGWIDAQLASYPLDVCPVSGEKLCGMGEPVNALYGTTLVRLCCKGCKKGLEKDGAALVAKVEAARKAKQ